MIPKTPKLNGQNVPIIGYAPPNPQEPPMFAYDSSLGVLVMPHFGVAVRISAIPEGWRVDPIGMARLPRVDFRRMSGQR